jgi:uncharacterized tellurite resistance protein B-like protein
MIEQGLRGSAAPDEPRQREHAVRVATAALLVELARADFREDVVENEAIFDLLRRHFALSAEESEALMQSAEQEADAAVSLHGFTRLLNDELDAVEKARVVELLWRVGFADERLHRYEDHLVRKVAELLYVPHSEVVRLRHQAEQAMRGSSETRE